MPLKLAVNWRKVLRRQLDKQESKQTVSKIERTRFKRMKSLIVLIAISLSAVQVLADQIEAESAPEPYAFSYTSESQGGFSSHNESRDDKGRVRGYYTILGEDGRERRVDYEADENGYRANVTTNEIGTRTGPTGDVSYLVSPPSQAQLDAAGVSAEQYQYLEYPHEAERWSRSGARQFGGQLADQRRQQALASENRWQSAAGLNQVALAGRSSRQAAGYQQQGASSGLVGGVKTLLPARQAARKPQAAQISFGSGASQQPITSTGGSSGDNYFANKFQLTSSGSLKPEQQVDDNDIRQRPVWLLAGGQKDSTDARQELPASQQEAATSVQPPAASSSSQSYQQSARQTLTQSLPQAHQQLSTTGNWPSGVAAHLRPGSSILQRQMEQQFMLQLAEPDYPRQVHIDDSEVPITVNQQQTAQQWQQQQQQHRWQQPNQAPPRTLPWKTQQQQQQTQQPNKQPQPISVQPKDQQISRETPIVPEISNWTAQQQQQEQLQQQVQTEQPKTRPDYTVEVARPSKSNETLGLNVNRLEQVNQETTFGPQPNWSASTSALDQQQQWLQQSDVQIQQADQANTVLPEVVPSLSVQPVTIRQPQPLPTTLAAASSITTRAPLSSADDLWRGSVSIKPTSNSSSWQVQDQISGFNAPDLVATTRRPFTVTQAPNLLISSSTKTTMSEVELADKPIRGQKIVASVEGELIRPTIGQRVRPELSSPTSLATTTLRPVQRGIKGGSRLASSGKQFWRQSSIVDEAQPDGVQLASVQQQQTRTNWTGQALANAAFGYRVSGAAVASQAKAR